LIDEVLSNVGNEEVIAKVKDQVRMKMNGMPLNIW
jgi:hypothetical protein